MKSESFAAVDDMTRVPSQPGERWLAWARELQGLAQTGLTYATGPYDVERYKRLMEIAAEILSAHTGESTGPIVAAFMREPGYATPKIDVRGAVVQDGKILLVQERSDGKWCMPGGWADIDELPSEMVVREVREESGFVVVPRKVVGVFDANRTGVPRNFFHAYKVVFLCELLGGVATPSNETSAVAFFDFADLPELSENRTHARHLREIQAHLTEPGRMAAFD
jgi:ADP-ribose pyrophosphatase YjhB (NUDIX family)